MTDLTKIPGIGKKMAQHLVNAGLGHKMVMTSTQVDEEAQHFYRKLGYKDRGGLFLDNTPFTQPQEMFVIKILEE